jgi:hypothetical protein
VSSCRPADERNTTRIDQVLIGVVAKPGDGAPDIVERRRMNSLLHESVRDRSRDVPLLCIVDEVATVIVAVASLPASAVDEHEKRRRLYECCRPIQVEGESTAADAAKLEPTERFYGSGNRRFGFHKINQADSKCCPEQCSVRVSPWRAIDALYLWRRPACAENQEEDERAANTLECREGDVRRFEYRSTS